MTEVERLMAERFSKDALLALATQADGVPHVRAVNAYYHDGAFYCITHAQSGKMKQIASSPVVGLCGDWFTGHGRAKNLGWIGAQENREIAGMLRGAFEAWLSNGHVDLNDRNTVILRIALTDGVLMSHGVRYEI